MKTNTLLLVLFTLAVSLGIFGYAKTTQESYTAEMNRAISAYLGPDKHILKSSVYTEEMAVVTYTQNNSVCETHIVSVRNAPHEGVFGTVCYSKTEWAEIQEAAKKAH